MAVTAKRMKDTKLSAEKVSERIEEQLRHIGKRSASRDSDEKWRFRESDPFIEDAELLPMFQSAMDELVTAGLIYESLREALAILRASGRSSHHDQQSVDTAYADLSDKLADATYRLLHAQSAITGASERLDVYFHQKSGLSALDTMRGGSLTNAVIAGLSEHWGHLHEESIWAADDRRERITNTAIALSVLRTIAKREEEADSLKAKQDA
jgi:hypothetical protein